MKKILLLAFILVSLAQAKASDTLTLRQIYSFSVGDTLDYANSLNMSFQGAPGVSGGFNASNYLRYLITAVNTSANNDTVTYTRQMLYPGSQVDYLQYYNLDSPVSLGFDTLRDSIYMNIYISSLSDGRIINELSHNNPVAMVNNECSFGQGLGVTDTTTGGWDIQVDPINEVDLVATYHRRLIYFAKGSDRYSEPYYIVNHSQYVHYTPIPEDCSYWNYSQYPGPNEPIIYQIRTGTKVYQNNHTYVELILRSYINNILSGDSTVGYFRNDTAGHKVYYCQIPGAGGESLLYDFTLGPSANINNPLYSSMTLDTGDINGTRHTIWTYTTMDPFGNATVAVTVEGEGAEYGLFQSPGVYALPYGRGPVFAPILVSFCSCDSASGQCQVLTGIDDISNKAAIKVYPNPATDQIQVSSADAGKYTSQIILTDIIGQEVYSSSINSNESTHDISKLPAGIYTWRLIQNNATIRSGKLVKE